MQDRTSPFGFFSWHRYTDNPWEIPLYAKAARSLLDTNGYSKTEVHFNEWNYLPNNDWSPMSGSGIGIKRERWFAEISGPAGAAFAGSVLLLLQDSQIDSAQYFTGEIQGFGLFNFHGKPQKTFYAFKAFSQLLDCPVRLITPPSAEGGWVFGAGMGRDGRTAAILACNLKCPDSNLTLDLNHIPWGKGAHYEIYCVNANHNLDRIAEGALLNDHPCKLPATPPPLVLLIKLGTVKNY